MTSTQPGLSCRMRWYLFHGWNPGGFQFAVLTAGWKCTLGRWGGRHNNIPGDRAVPHTGPPCWNVVTGVLPMAIMQLSSVRSKNGQDRGRCCRKRSGSSVYKTKKIRKDTKLVKLIHLNQMKMTEDMDINTASYNLWNWAQLTVTCCLTAMNLDMLSPDHVTSSKNLDLASSLKCVNYNLLTFKMLTSSPAKLLMVIKHTMYNRINQEHHPCINTALLWIMLHWQWRLKCTFFFHFANYAQ